METNSFKEDIEKDDSQVVPMLRAGWFYFRTYWKWFLLSAIVFLALGYYYQQRQPRVYQRQAVMLLEDTESSSPMRSGKNRSGGLSTLLQLNGVSVGDNLKNEIFILSSNRLMERVVDSLGLDVDYSVTRCLHTVALYRERPFELAFEGHADRLQVFKVRPEKDRTYTLYDFQTADDDEPLPTQVTIKAGETVKTPIGKVRLTENRARKASAADEVVSITRMPVKMAAKVFAGKVSAEEYNKESTLIVLTCNDINPGRAEDVLNELFEAYKQDVVDNKNRVATNTASFIDERIRIISNELSGVENRLAGFKRDNSLIDFTSTAQTYITEGSTAHRQVIELETQLAVARYLNEFLDDQAKTHETVPLLNITNASFNTAIADYNKLMIERNRMVENSSETSPAVREADRQLASLRSSIVTSLGSYVSSVQLQLERARANEQRLTGKMNTVPDKEKEGLDIQRQQELKSALYTYLLNKREEVALQMAVNEANVRLVEEPLGTNMPVSPKKKVILLISLLIGIAVPAAVLYLRRMLDVSISGRKDVEAATTIPIIGEVPRYEEAIGHRGVSLIKDAESNAPIMEAFRMLRYGLNFMRHSAKVFVVTSATPGHGKSFISCNLAYILGVAGKRVLFVDTDIRRRTATKTFGNTPGLTGLLVDEENTMTLADAVIPAGICEGVDILPAGKMPPNPSELLMSDKFDAIIEEAKQAYDYVVIDTTPSFSVADADIVNRVAQITVFVMRVGVQNRNNLPDIERMYQKKKFRNLCIVINDADTKHSYGYGYGYGYGYKDDKRNKASLLKCLFGRS